MVRTVTLADGKVMPAMAFGMGSAGHFKDAEKAKVVGTAALRAGFKHLDTAQLYLTERSTAESIKEAGLNKDDVFVCSKLSENTVTATTAEVISGAVRETIEQLGFKPDLFLIHNPFVIEAGKIGAAWTILEGLVADGTLGGTSLGVSNFRPQDLEAVLAVATIKPVINQVEYHPYVLAHLDPVKKIQDEHGILFQAFGPLTPLLRHPTGGPIKPILERVAARLARETGKPVDAHAALTLWFLTQNIPIVTASGNVDRIPGLAAIEQLPDLTQDEVEEIAAAGRKVHFRHYREHMEVDFALPDLPADL